ncbi:DNA/RNA non-specific endonuclease [Longimicrobium sp.]|uniref:DNA/RNA non-specific endonuclease n=1 Tax=Longimicrobium sp. TaxID=2029185 RepID=UPI002E3328B2|nr:DNA/RNA non-specific endonuclease [Longimicrobium sp.]HEX6036709.1 DNA/RNA non-specific endonuclease [Longimicrobium sp.]
MKTAYPGDRMLDLQQARTAALRYKDRALPETFAFTEAAEAPADNRKTYLKTSLTHERARAVVTEAESNGARRSSSETLAMLAQERIIGSSDLRDINYLELAVAVARAICRIRIGSAAGSGVLVGPRLLMTNNHVLRSPDDALLAEAQFDYQENVSGDLLPVHAFRLDPGLFFVTDPTLDFTVVGVAETSGRGQPLSRYPWMKLIPTLGKAEKGDPINIIQHPRGGLKQIALRNNEVIDIPTGKPDFLYYTTDTEPGSSGSPCFNDQWEIIALHHSGVPLMDGDRICKVDGNPWDEDRDDPALIKWIANEGARTSALVAALNAAPLGPAARDALDVALGDAAPNPVELARGSAGPSSAPAPAAGPGGITGGIAVPAAGSVSVTVPLTITVSLGEVASPGVSVGAPAPADPRPADPRPADPSGAGAGPVRTEKLVVDVDWAARKGYDPDFLDVAVPLPVLSAKMKADSVTVPPEYRVNGDEHVLAYHHYSLVMNAKRRFAWYSAANVDGMRRPPLPERKDDDWYIDPRIDDPKRPVFQCGEDLYAAKKTDRGHLTRYLDVAWGTREEALKALADTFHFTNCCLQLSSFNQTTARWQGIEQFLLERKAKKDKLRISVITGPLFSARDPKYRNEFMDAPVRVPLEFWKVCALVREDGTLSATAFILSQDDITSLPGFEAFLDVKEVQTTIRNVEKRTGLKFPVLRDNDHLAKGGAAGTLEMDRQTVIPLRSYDDIVV